MRSPQEAQQHAPLDEEREREAIEAGRMELHRLFHEEHGNDARELIRDNDGQYINEKTRDVWEWCEKIIMASLAHARKQQDLVTKEISLPGGDKQQEERDHLRGTTEMIDPQGCRERFEATWANSCCVNDEATLRKGGVFDRDEYDGKYWNNHLESCWKLWQACERRFRATCGKQRERVCICGARPHGLSTAISLLLEAGLDRTERAPHFWERVDAFIKSHCGGRVEEVENGKERGDA